MISSEAADRMRNMMVSVVRGGTGRGRPSASMATKTRCALATWISPSIPIRWTVTRTPTSMLVRPLQLTCPRVVRRSPNFTGSRKAIWSMKAVTAGPLECRTAATAPASSTARMITPPCTSP